MLSDGGNGMDVVSMTERERARNRAPLRIVEAYWNGLFQGSEVPLRSEVDPRGMENALEYAFLLERIAPTLGKIRVAGSHLSDLMGMQIAGMPLSSLIAPEDREEFGQAVARLFADPAVLRIRLKAEGGFGKPDMRAEMLLLPLRSDFGEVSRGLGALVTEGRIGRTPRRFRIEAIEVESAQSKQPAATVTPAMAPAAADAETAEKTADKPSLLARLSARHAQTPKAPEQAGKPDKPARGHLRLVVSND